MPAMAPATAIAMLAAVQPVIAPASQARETEFRAKLSGELPVNGEKAPIFQQAQIDERVLRVVDHWASTVARVPVNRAPAPVPTA